MQDVKQLTWMHYLLVFGCVFLFGVLAFVSTWDNNHAVDDINYVGWGHYYMLTGDYYSLELYHPPLTMYLLNIPNYFLTLPPIRQWDTTDQHALGYYYLYKSGYDPQFLTRIERIPIVAVSMLLVFLIWLWSFELFGWKGSLVSLIFSAFFPPFIGNGSIIVTDMVSAFTIALALYLFWRWLIFPSTSHAMFVGAALGLALMSKLTAVFLIPIFVICWIWRRLTSKEERKWYQVMHPKDLLWQITLIVIFGFAVLWAGYGFDLQTIHDSIPVRYLGEGGRADDYYAEFENVLPLSSQTSSWLWNKLPLPLTSYAMTWFYTINLNENGGWVYLLGMNKIGSWWYYFPVAFLYKTPISFIIALLLAIFFLCSRSYTEDWFIPLLAALIFFAAQMTSNINYGVRHILHVYVFLLVLVGVLGSHFMRRWLRMTVCFLLLWAILAAVITYPQYLSYFNELALGKGERILLDSNIDFGQDLRPLGIWMQDKNISSVQLSFYGTADPNYFLSNYTYLGSVLGRGIPLREICTVTPGYAAISLNNLYAVYFENKSCFADLRDQKPLARIGASINVYQIT